MSTHHRRRPAWAEYPRSSRSNLGLSVYGKEYDDRQCAMAYGSTELLRAIWTSHAPIMRFAQTKGRQVARP